MLELLLAGSIELYTGAVVVINPVEVLVWLPLLFVVVSVTVYVPAAEYKWEGLIAVEVVVSPKFQRRDVIVPVDVSVNATVRGIAPVKGVAVKLDTGRGCEVTTSAVDVFVWLPPSLVAVRVTV